VKRKVVGRGVATGLVVICILLAVGLVGVFAYYTMTLNNKNAEYDDYVSSHSHTDSDYNSLNSQITSKDSQISQLNSNVTNLQNQVNDLTSTLNLAKSEVWVTSQTVSQPAGSYNFWGHSYSYAGYVTVQVESSTTDKTYIEVLGSAHGINYDNRISVGVSGTGVFPVLPSNNLEVRVGNSNILNGATETVTITYHY
jgi:cell division protein FtsL